MHTCSHYVHSVVHTSVLLWNGLSIPGLSEPRVILHMSCRIDRTASCVVTSTTVIAIHQFFDTMVDLQLIKVTG